MPSALLFVIIGSHGTGKPTLAKEVARKKAGVIYVTVPPEKPSSTEVEDRLTSALREALNWRERVAPWRMMLLSTILNEPNKWLQPGKRVLIFVFIVPRTKAISSRLPPATRPGMALAPSSLLIMSI